MILKFEQIKNIRDLSEMKRKDGKKIKTKKLLRGAELMKATDEDIKVLSEKYGIKVIVDFRGEADCLERPNKDIPGAEYINIPALPIWALPKLEDENSSEFEKFMDNPFQIFMNIYEALALSEESTEAYRKFFQVLIDNNCPPVYWHCKQGKDRTGIAAFLLLTILGFERQDIIEEYLITNEAMKEEFEIMKTELLPEEKHKLQIYDVIMFVKRECIERYISLIEEKYGSVDNYIRDGLKIDNEKIKSLQEGYVE